MLTLVADFGHWVNNISHIYLCTVDGHLGSFQHLAISYNAVVTILVPVFGTYICISDGGYSWCVIARSWVCVYSALGDAGKAILFQFLNNNLVISIIINMVIKW